MTADPGLVPIPDVSQSGFHPTIITPMQTCSLPVTNVAVQQCPVSMPYMLPQPNTLAAINPAALNLAAMNNPATIFPAAIDPAAVRTPVFSVPNIPPQIRTQLPVKRFQVEDVAEVESPNTSDVSAHSSTENLVRELSKSGSQDADAKVTAQILGPLGSTSGSSISVEMEHLSFPPAEHLHYPPGIVEHPSIQRAATQMAEYPPLQVPPADPCIYLFLPVSNQDCGPLCLPTIHLAEPIGRSFSSHVEPFNGPSCHPSTHLSTLLHLQVFITKTLGSSNAHLAPSHTSSCHTPTHPPAHHDDTFRPQCTTSKTSFYICQLHKPSR